MTLQEPKPSRGGPIAAGLVLGLLLSLTPLSEADDLSGKALWTLGIGLGTTYLSVGILVAFLPAPAVVNKRRMAGFLFGLLVGAAYSVPGAFFTMVPYPLSEDAASYWREFADGGVRAFLLTLGFGGIIGGLTGLFRKRL